MRAVVTRWLSAGLALALSVHALGTYAVGSVAPTVPEIGPATISGGLALLAGGILMLRARRRSK